MTQISRMPRSRAMRAASHAPPRERRTVMDSELAMRVDWILIGACVALALIGLLMIYSASRNIVEWPGIGSCEIAM